MEQITLSISEVFGWSIGVSALVAVAFGGLWSIWFNRIKEGQRAEFEKQIETQKAEFLKELEILKAKNDKLNYITKTQFDAEFKMYQEILDQLYQAQLAATLLHVDNTILAKQENPEQYILELNIKANQAINKFLRSMRRYSPFINKNICDIFFKLGGLQLEYIANNETLEKLQNNSAQNEFLYKELKFIYDEVIEQLRTYLQTIRVMDGNNE